MACGCNLERLALIPQAILKRIQQFHRNAPPE